MPAVMRAAYSPPPLGLNKLVLISDLSISSGATDLGNTMTACYSFTAFEPFEPDFLSHGEPSAYPPDCSLAIIPSSIFFGNTSADGFMDDAMHHSAASLVEAGIKEGQDLKNAAPYVKYALLRTPLKTMHGESLERVREIKKRYDPDNVMGLTGGWKF